MTKSPILKTISLTLCVVLLTFMVGRAQRVSAMALPDIVDEIAPVYNATIYQFEDYVQNGLTDPQQALLYFLLGMYLVGTAGLTDYTISNPYATQDGVVNWIKSCGVELYNTVAQFMTLYDPTVAVEYGVDYRPYIQQLASEFFGVAQYASRYTDLSDFFDYMSSVEAFGLKFTPDGMFALNQVLASQGGLFEWQTKHVLLTPNQFNFTWVTSTLTASQLQTYQSYYDTYITTPVHFNVSGHYSNLITSDSELLQYHNIFANTHNGTVYLCDDSGNIAPSRYYDIAPSIGYETNSYRVKAYYQGYFNSDFNTYTHSLILSNYSDLGALFNAINANPSLLLSGPTYNLADFIQHLYVGDSWSDKDYWYADYDLGFLNTSSSSTYIPSSDILLDIKGLLSDLLDVTYLYQPVLDNIFFPDGTPLTIGDLVKVTIDVVIPDEYKTPALPVNLNDVALYTDNDYLSQLKETAKAGSSILRDYTVFWYNVDPALVYLVFGSFILILVAAFVGKWGHS